MPPPVAAAALAALEIAHREPDRSARLHERARQFASACRQAGLDLGTSIGEAIIPVMAGDSIRAAMLSQRLAQRNVNVQPIIAPAVPDGLARLRFFLSSEHDTKDIAASVEAIAREFAALSGATPLAIAPGAGMA